MSEPSEPGSTPRSTPAVRCAWASTRTPRLLEPWGLSADLDGLARFAVSCVAAFGDVAAVIKPQSAFFEAYGSGGIAVLEGTIAAAREAGALVLLDVKRGDIGTTMAAYAAAYLDPASSLAADA